MLGASRYSTLTTSHPDATASTRQHASQELTEPTTHPPPWKYTTTPGADDDGEYTRAGIPPAGDGIVMSRTDATSGPAPMIALLPRPPPGLVGRELPQRRDARRRLPVEYLLRLGVHRMAHRLPPSTDRRH